MSEPNPAIICPCGAEVPTTLEQRRAYADGQELAFYCPACEYQVVVCADGSSFRVPKRERLREGGLFY